VVELTDILVYLEETLGRRVKIGVRATTRRHLINELWLGGKKIILLLYLNS
jgi:hypothetical protein